MRGGLSEKHQDETSGLFAGLLSEGGINLVLLDARRRIAALTEILLFGAVTHHSGVSNARLLLAVLRCGFVRHMNAPCAGAHPSTRRVGTWFPARSIAKAG